MLSDLRFSFHSLIMDDTACTLLTIPSCSSMFASEVPSFWHIVCSPVHTSMKRSLRKCLSGRLLQECKPWLNLWSKTKAWQKHANKSVDVCVCFFNTWGCKKKGLLLLVPNKRYRFFFLLSFFQCFCNMCCCVQGNTRKQKQPKGKQRKRKRKGKKKESKKGKENEPKGK